MLVDASPQDAVEPVGAPTAPARAGSHRWAVLRAVLAVAVVAAVCWAAVAQRGAVLTALRALRAPAPGWVVAAVLAEVASMGLYARMQRRLLRGAGTAVPLHRAVALAYAAHSMSITLPGGPLISTVYNYRRMRGFGADSTVAAWCTAASGLLSTLGLAVLAAVVGVAAAVDDTDDVLPVALVLAALLVLAGSARLLRRRPELTAALHGWLRDRVGRRLPDRARQWGAELGAWLGRLLRVRIPPGDLAAASVFSVANWVADGLCLALCCRALGVEVGVVPLALTYIAGMTASSLPIVPGGLGTVDGALALGLVAAGTATASALAVVVLYRLISLVLIGGVGWVLWLAGRRAEKSARRTMPPGVARR
jgi:putative heme transporter